MVEAAPALPAARSESGRDRTKDRAAIADLHPTPSARGQAQNPSTGNRLVEPRSNQLCRFASTAFRNLPASPFALQSNSRTNPADQPDLRWDAQCVVYRPWRMADSAIAIARSH